MASQRPLEDFRRRAMRLPEQCSASVVPSTIVFNESVYQTTTTFFNNNDDRLMLITYLGHAGFCVETDSSIVLMDPWLSSSGAFDSSWFQYPKNHHLAESVQQTMESTSKEKYIYISHEHTDHFDLSFLQSLRSRDFTVILANFYRPVVRNALLSSNFVCKAIVNLNTEEEYLLPDGSIRLFLVDAEVDCDSAILLKSGTKSFLNLNDCKVHEKLGHIAETYGRVDVLTTQFSGAVWHPVCYEMSPERYEELSQKKNTIKCELTADAIATLKPSVYLPSAGPPCFLDPMLIEKNFEKVNIFPRARSLLNYLDKHCEGVPTIWPEVMPGDMLDVDTLQFVKLASDRPECKDFERYVRSYAEEYADHFKNRDIENKKVDPHKVFLALKKELVDKLSRLKLVNKDVTTLLYWKILEYPDAMYEIDFKHKKIDVVDKIADPQNFWSITAPAWQVEKVLTKQLDWPDFALTFRVKIKRNPDVYHILMHGFLALDAESLPRYCEVIKHFHTKKERTIVEFEGKRYSVLRWCPHQGVDLSEGWIENGCLVCPRHRWQYDLRNQGQCIYNDESIDAICLDDLTVEAQPQVKQRR